MKAALFLALMFWLGGESGASFPWSSKWQSAFGLNLRQVPEILTAFILGLVSVSGYINAGLNDGLLVIFFLILSVMISYSGIQSANWMFLKWTKNETPATGRNAKIKPVVDFIAGLFGWSLGDEGYSWVAASIKGTIITLPMGGLGGVLFALGYEAGSHARTEKLRSFIGGDTHWISEGLSFFLIGVYAVIYMHVIKRIFI